MNVRPCARFDGAFKTPSGSWEPKAKKERSSSMLTIGLAAAWFALAMTGVIAVGDYRAK
jgi:hypothetical protein